jgi:hypothetical protein
MTTLSTKKFICRQLALRLFENITLASNKYKRTFYKTTIYSLLNLPPIHMEKCYM